MEKPARRTDDILVSAIEAKGRKAFDPEGDDASCFIGQAELSSLVSRIATAPLMAALTSLIQPDRIPQWLRGHLIDILALLPQRPDGVRATLEFVFSVHPSSAVKASDIAAVHRQGANITMEAMKLACHMISTPPASTTPEVWYPGLAPQLFSLLDGKDGPDLARVAAYVIGYGILGRKHLGGPGTAGWRAFAERMLAPINPSLSTQEAGNGTVVFKAGPDEVVDLGRETTVVKADELALALARLKTLLDSHPNPGLTRRLLTPLMLPLWALSSWPDVDDKCQQSFCRPAMNLLSIFLKISAPSDLYLSIVKNLLFEGDPWRFESVGRSQIRTKQVPVETSRTTALDWAALEFKAGAFADLLDTTASDQDISSVFLALFKCTYGRQPPTVSIEVKPRDDLAEDPTILLIEVKVLQAMLDRLPTRLVTDSKGILDLVGQILSGFSSTQSSEATAIALSLLSIVVTTPSFRRSSVDSESMERIEGSLERIGKANAPDVSQTAANLSRLLINRDEMEDPSERPTSLSERQVEDRKTYNLAISYITEADPPPPVRSEGLNLLSGLVQANSPILDVQGIMVLLSSLLSQDEDYVNLQVMTLFTHLASKHPRSVVNELLDHYLDADEKLQVDARLRFGEAILRVVQRLGETFAGETARQTSESLLSVAGRRGHRPKTEARQARDEKARRRRQEEAEEAWGGEVPPDLGDGDGDEDEQTPEERARNDVLALILQGWESKRGSEDVRMRASALSLFAAGMETNIAGIGAALVEAAFDLCVSVLTMEPEMEKAILRRAAVLLILAFVNALAEAKKTGRSLGFGLADPSREDTARILRYVAQTDNDGLVQQHARDVVESLENWQMIAILPERLDPDPGLGLGSVDGLDIRRNMARLGLGTGEDAGRPRPRIEEVD